MELAVCLSKYADKPDEAMEIFRQLVLIIISIIISFISIDFTSVCVIIIIRTYIFTTITTITLRVACLITAITVNLFIN